MDNSRYYWLESGLQTLAKELSCFSDSERAEVLHFVEVGEFGLALKTAYAIILEENLVVTSDNKLKMILLASEMGISDAIDIDRLT